MRRLLALVALAALCLSASAYAQARVEMTALGTFVSLSGTNRVDTDVAFDIHNGAGGGLFLGASFGPLTVEAGAFFLRAQGNIQYQNTTGIDLDNIDLIPIMLVARFHPLAGQFVDPYIGVGGAYVIGQNLHSNDLDVSGVGVIDVESKAAFVGNIGLGIKIANSVYFVVDGRYMPLKLDTKPKAGGSTFELTLNPLLVSGGFRVKF